MEVSDYGLYRYTAIRKNAPHNRAFAYGSLGRASSGKLNRNPTENLPKSYRIDLLRGSDRTEWAPKSKVRATPTPIQIGTLRSGDFPPPHRGHLLSVIRCEDLGPAAALDHLWND